MPIFEFKCNNCNHIFEEFYKGQNLVSAECPKCHEIAPKILSSSHFIINGYNAKNGYSKEEGK